MLYENKNEYNCDDSLWRVLQMTIDDYDDENVCGVIVLINTAC
jgi:hypothetical protein